MNSTLSSAQSDMMPQECLRQTLRFCVLLQKRDQQLSAV